MYKDKINIFYANDQSLLCHKHELETLIEKRKTDILCVCDTWLYPSMRNEYINISSYKIYREDHVVVEVCAYM